MSSADALSVFAEALAAAGLVVEGVPVADGALHRCGVAGNPRGKDGAYRIHRDAPACCWWRNWGTGDTGTRTLAPEKDMSPAERQTLRERIAAARKAAEEEQSKRHAAATKLARVLWERATPAPDSHAYLVRKQVPALGLRQDAQGRLVVPVRDADGGLVSLQFILPEKPVNGPDKLFLKGGRTAGGWFAIPARNGGHDGPLCIAEGYATAASIHLATGHACLAAFNAGNLSAVASMARKRYPDREIILCADNDVRTDDRPNTGVEAATKAAQAVGGKLAVCPAHEGRPTDFNDLHCLRSLEAVAAAVEKARKEGAACPVPEKGNKYRCLNIEELITRDYPPREMILAPVLAVQSLSMIFAMRGVGKTFFALSCAYAVASGGGVFGRWFAPRPARVLYIDGEMPAVTLQERLKSIAISADSDITDPDMLRILTPDEQDGPMPNLGTREGQEAVEQFLDDVALVVVDNLATLARTGKENDSDSWVPVQEWLLALRRRGISVLLVHHAGKNGSQRGTGAKEDILDTVIELKRPSDYRAEQGARFEVHFTKARGLYGEDTEPFEAMLSIDEQGQCSWTTRKVADLVEQRVLELLEAGCSEREIAEELKDDHVGRTRIRRIRQFFEAQGKSFPRSRGGAGTHRKKE